MTHEVRHRSFRMRAVEDAPEGVVEGYITVFGTAYDIGWGLREQIEPGAFDGSLSETEGVIPIYYQHDHRTGGTPIGTGTVTRDAKGYLVRAELFVDDDPKARAVWRTMAKGALREWSVGFTTPEDGDVVRDRDLESIVRGDLMEASVVLRGANPDTETLAVREEPTAPAPAAEKPAEPETRSVPDEWLDRISEPHIRALVREVAMTANDLRDALRTELCAAYGQGPDAYVWLVDHNDEVVWFEVSGTGSDGTYQQSYAKDDTGDVELTGSRVPVTRRTVYVADSDD